MGRSVGLLTFCVLICLAARPASASLLAEACKLSFGGICDLSIPIPVKLEVDCPLWRLRCSVTVRWEDYGVDCDGNGALKLLKQVSQMCKCVDKVKGIRLADVASCPTGELNDKVAELGSCMVDNGLNVEPKPEEARDRLPSGVIALPEIDSAFYLKVAQGAGVCLSSGFLQCTALVGSLKNYIKDFNKALRTGVKDQVRDVITEVTDAVDHAVKLVKRAPAMATKALQGVRKRVGEQAAGDLAQIAKEIDDVVRSAEAVLGTLDATQKLSTDINDATEAVDQLLSATPLDVADLPELVGNLPKLLRSITSPVTSFGALVKAVEKAPGLVAALGETRFTIPKLAEVDGLENLANDVPAWQEFEAFMKEIDSAWGDVTDKVKRISKLSPRFDVMTYSREFGIISDLPAARTRRVCARLLGYEECVEVPELHIVKRGLNVKIPMPNHHIPYGRLFGPSDKKESGSLSFGDAGASDSADEDAKTKSRIEELRRKISEQREGYEKDLGIAAENREKIKQLTLSIEDLKTNIETKLQFAATDRSGVETMQSIVSTQSTLAAASSKALTDSKKKIPKSLASLQKVQKLYSGWMTRLAAVKAKAAIVEVDILRLTSELTRAGKKQ